MLPQPQRDFLDVGDLEHHLVRAFALRRSSSRPNLWDHQLGRGRVRQAQLRAVPVADADVFDEAEDSGVPRHGRSDVGHGQNGSHSRVRRRPVCKHPIRLDRLGHPRPSPSRMRHCRREIGELRAGF